MRDHNETTSGRILAMNRHESTKPNWQILSASSSGDIGFFSGDIEKSKSPD
jgi:hypothetical protein